MDATTLGVLAATAVATSILSAIVGMAGGIVLLTVMLLFFEPLVAIPLHGLVQLVSNSSRTVIQRAYVDWDLVWRYSVLLLPMGFLGLGFLRALPPDGARALIGAFVLVATWLPGMLLLGTHPDRLDRGRRFLVLGGVVGALNTVVGATGPLIAPFFLDLGMERRALIGTKAACQTLGHLAKAVIFGVAGFAFLGFLAPLAVLAASVVLGTWLGSRILGRVSEATFVRLYKTILTLVALRLVVWDGLAAFGWR